MGVTVDPSVVPQAELAIGAAVRIEGADVVVELGEGPASVEAHEGKNVIERALERNQPKVLKTLEA